jgi:hypothetical protein
MPPAPLGKTLENKLLRSLNRKLEFATYLEALGYCMLHGKDIRSLVAWWDDNHHLLTPTNPLLELAGLLDQIEFHAAVNPAPSTADVTSPVDSVSKACFATYLPWAEEVLQKAKDDREKNRIHQVVEEYAQYLAAHAPEGLSNARNRIANLVVHPGSPEYDHLATLSAWVSTLSGIPNCHFVFDAILGRPSPLTLDTGDLFKAVIQCPHKLFRLFMGRDLSAYDFSNGEALLHLLSLPLALDPDDKGPAHLTPDYPFFSSAPLPLQFDLSAERWIALAHAWQRFYAAYSTLSTELNFRKPFVGGQHLFVLTVSSLMENNGSPTGPEFKKILEATEPNIWCVHSWLNTVILGRGSSSWQAAYFEKLSGYVPYFVSYFFELAHYGYDRHVADLSSRTLLTGILQLDFWTEGDAISAQQCVDEYFTVLVNHRRTDTLMSHRFYLIQLLLNRYPNDAQLSLTWEELFKVLDPESFQTVEDMGQNPRCHRANSPSILDLNYDSYPIPGADEVFHADFLTYVSSALNTNGGDIWLTLPLKKHGEQTNISLRINQVLASIEHQVPADEANILVITRLQQRTGYAEIWENIWLKCLRGSRPVWINSQGLPWLAITDANNQQPKKLYGTQAREIITQRFPLCHQRQSLMIAS